MKNLSSNSKRAGFAWLPVMAIGGIFVAAIITGVVYLEYQQIKYEPKIGGQFDEVGSQVKMDTPLGAAKEIYNRLVNSFFAPLPIAPIDLDSVPSDSAVSSPVLESTPSSEPKPSGGTVLKTVPGIFCLVSNQSFQNALDAYEVAVPAYEKAAADIKLPCSAGPGGSCEVRDENYWNAYQRLSTAFNTALLTYEEILPTCNPSERLKAETCVAKYEKALAGCTPGQPTDPCFFADTQNAINSCFR